MKRFLAVILLLALMVPAFAMAEEMPFMGYYSDFTMGMDGWYPRSADGTMEIKRMGYAVEMRGRTAAWNSPGRDFDLKAGEKYIFSVEVKQTAVERKRKTQSMSIRKTQARAWRIISMSPVSRFIRSPVRFLE